MAKNKNRIKLTTSPPYPYESEEGDTFEIVEQQYVKTEPQHVRIASQTGCPDCWGSGIREVSPFYYECCIFCGGTGVIPKTPKEEEQHAACKDE